MSGSFESVRWNACEHRLDLGLYSHLKEFWGNGVRTHVNSKGKIPSTGKKILPREVSNPRRCIKQDSEPNTITNELFRTPSGYSTTLLIFSLRRPSRWPSASGVADSFGARVMAKLRSPRWPSG